MNWLKISVQSPPELSEAVADIFYEIGSGGVVIEDPALISEYIASGEWDAYEIDQEVLTRNYDIIIGYLVLNDNNQDVQNSQTDRNVQEKLDSQVCAGCPKTAAALDCPPACQQLLNNLRLLERKSNQLLEVVIQEVADDNWADKWKEYFKPCPVGERIVVCPSWEQYESKPNELIIQLDPGLAFGTGTHPTTSMCIKALEKTVRGGELVYDIGTGSGILSVAAALLGAGKVRAFDIDSVAVRVAKENIAINKLEKLIEVDNSDLFAKVDQPSDIIIANIVADVIISMLPDVPKLLNKGGIFIASGIIDTRWPDVRSAVEQTEALTVEEVFEDKDWVAIKAVKL